MRKLIRFFPLIICFLLLSCTGDIKVSIFTRDLSDVMSSKKMYFSAPVIHHTLR